MTFLRIITSFAVKLRSNKFALSEKHIMFVMKLEMTVTSVILTFKNLISNSPLKNQPDMVRYYFPSVFVFFRNYKPQEMKTITSSLLVNRLIISVFTLASLLTADKANAFTKYINANNPGIEYASLAATANENAVFINWVTAFEQNNNHFEVERSTDMKAFKTVAMVLDGFTSTGTTGKTYKFKEAAGEVKKGKTVYYRLKQIDNDNQVHYSAVMAVQMNSTVTIFPKSNNLGVQVKNTKGIYPNGQTLLSKQTTSSMGQISTSAAGSTELTAAVLNPSELILGTELTAPKLTLA
jgi:hypothetical protein